MVRMLTLGTEQTQVMVVDSRPEDYVRMVADSALGGLLFQFAVTGSDALKLRRTAGRLIWLVNINLPDGSGCELAAAIRAREPHAAVFLVGDQYDACEELKALIVGGAMYLCKPVEGGWFDQINDGSGKTSAAFCRCA